ncbi:MAG: hypothetical protein L6Q60_14150 [Rhodocyclaceae bacterium]|nr:hypothetical protein [Rhodocyclaceae bacterium]
MKAIRNRAALAALIVAVPLAVLPPSAVGGSVGGNGGATEVTQLLNNAELAMQTIQDEIRNLTIMKQLATDVMQQIPLGEEFAEMFTEAKQTYKDVSGALNATQKLYGTVSNAKDLAMFRIQQFSASGLDWKDYLKRETDLARWRGEQTTFLAQNEQMAIAAVQQAFSQVEEFQSRIGRTSGTHQAVGLMNAQMQTLIGLNATALQSSSAHYQAQTAAMQLEIGERERAAKLADEWKRAQDEANKRSREKLGGGK